MSNTKAIDKVINVLKSLYQQKFINLNFFCCREIPYFKVSIYSRLQYKRICGYVINNVSFRYMFIQVKKTELIANKT